MYSGIKRKETWEVPVAKHTPNENTTSYTKTPEDILKERLEQAAMNVLQSKNPTDTMMHLQNLKNLEDEIRNKYTKEQEAKLLEPIQRLFQNFKLEL